MSQITLNGIHLSLTGPSSLPLSVVLRDSPTYDGPRNFFTVSLTNSTSQTLSLPFDEMQRNIALAYREPATREEKVNNQTPPPKMDGAVLQLLPDESKSFQVVFEYPIDLAKMKRGVAEIEFCVRWQKEWLRATAYASNPYDWNESYELCHLIRIVDVDE